MPEPKLRGCGALSERYDRALATASNIHQEQLRKGTRVPYISHLLAVSSLVLEDDGSENQAIAGLLHDAVEDGPLGTRDRVLKEFGEEVLAMVLACTDSEPDGSGEKEPWTLRKERYVAHLATSPLEALLVTAADKVHNLRCTVEDLRVSKTWPAFNSCLHQQLWYYAAISSVLSTRLPNSRLTSTLEALVDDLATESGQDRPPPSATAPRCTVCARAAE